MKLEKLSPDQWKWLAERAHKAVFAEVRPEEMDRVSFVLLAVEGSDPVGYMTVQERDADTAHLQFGGVFPPVRGTPKAVRAWALALGRLREQYKRVTMFVENSNSPMLRLGLALDFKIIGIKHQGGKLLLEHMLDFSHGGP